MSRFFAPKIERRKSHKAKTKLERIANIEEEIKQLENQKKQLLQQYKEQERKERTHRICKRGGLLESMLPDTVPLTDEQFKTFLEKTVANDFGRRMLASIAAQSTTTPADKPAVIAREIRTSENMGENNDTRVSG